MKKLLLFLFTLTITFIISCSKNEKCAEDLNTQEKYNKGENIVADATVRYELNPELPFINDSGLVFTINGDTSQLGTNYLYNNVIERWGCPRCYDDVSFSKKNEGLYAECKPELEKGFYVNCEIFDTNSVKILRCSPHIRAKSDLQTIYLYRQNY